MANNHEKTVIREMQIYNEIPPLIILTQMAITKNTTSVDWSPPPLLMGIKNKQPRHSGNMVRHFLKELAHIT